MTTPRPRGRGPVTTVLRSPWLVPGAWVAGVAAAAALVFLPRAGGRPGVVLAALSVVLGAVLVAGVLVVAAALAAPVVRRLGTLSGAIARRQADRTRERPS